MIKKITNCEVTRNEMLIIFLVLPVCTLLLQFLWAVVSCPSYSYLGLINHYEGDIVIHVGRSYQGWKWDFFTGWVSTVKGCGC